MDYMKYNLENMDKTIEILGYELKCKYIYIIYINRLASKFKHKTAQDLRESYQLHKSKVSHAAASIVYKKNLLSGIFMLIRSQLF